MTSRKQINRDMFYEVGEQLRAAGVPSWTIKRTASGHHLLKFYRGGKPYTVTLAGSDDWRATKNSRRRIARVLEGKTPCQTTTISPTSSNETLTTLSKT